MWPIPLFYTFVFFVSYAVCKLGAKAFKIDSNKIPFTMLSILFSNNNTLPLCLIESIATSATAENLLWDQKPNDTVEKAVSRAIAYIVIYSGVSNIYRWTYGIKLLETDQSNLSAMDETENLVDGNSKPFYKSASIIGKWLKTIKDLSNPPILTIFISMFVGIVPFLKNSLYSQTGILSPLAQAIETCGGAAIPLTLIGLGTQIGIIMSKSSPQIKLTKEKVLVLVSRFLIIPIITIGVLLAIRYYFRLGDDPAFILITMILVSTPTAINLISLCQAVGSYEEEMAKLLFYSYTFAIPVMTLLVTFFLWVLEHMDFN